MAIGNLNNRICVRHLGKNKQHSKSHLLRQHPDCVHLKSPADLLKACDPATHRYQPG